MSEDPESQSQFYPTSLVMSVLLFVLSLEVHVVLAVRNFNGWPNPLWVWIIAGTLSAFSGLWGRNAYMEYGKIVKQTGSSITLTGFQSVLVTVVVVSFGITLSILIG